MFIRVNSDGSIEKASSTKFKDALGTTAGENPIILLHTSGHWQAVIPDKSTESSDKSNN